MSVGWTIALAKRLQVQLRGFFARRLNLSPPESQTLSLKVHRGPKHVCAYGPFFVNSPPLVVTWQQIRQKQERMRINKRISLGRCITGRYHLLLWNAIHCYARLLDTMPYYAMQCHAKQREFRWRNSALIVPSGRRLQPKTEGGYIFDGRATIAFQLAGKPLPGGWHSSATICQFSIKRQDFMARHRMLRAPRPLLPGTVATIDHKE